LSAGIRSSGLAISIANNMEVLHVVPYLLLTPVVALIVNIMTEFSSNVATATLFLPLLAEVAISIGWHPLLLMIPATFSSNFAFILPIATPPNAIAHATGYLKSADMFIPGLILKAAGIVLLTILTPTLGKRNSTPTIPSPHTLIHLSLLYSFLSGCSLIYSAYVDCGFC
jgi:sodium-dependent dicarboxylate transporter 2/3/5